MICLITGGASGIGLALATELVARGARVVIADISPATHVVASALGCDSVELDVTDAAAVQTAYADAWDRHGRIDVVFNNAGIATGGVAEELTLEHWNRTIDVNLRGVIHGVHAAYPLMLAQGHGHIVNTASLAGLTPAPLMAPYTTTKHAVVGLSLALRAEAAPRGIRVSAVCPSFVDTPLLDNVNPGMPGTSIGREVRAKIPVPLYSAEKLARDILRGVARNKALIVAPWSGRVAWWGARLAPGLATRISGRQVSRHNAGR
ncbi:SDR family NAD(P)-dependent oxidoreductase [Longispora fulva]|uniref:NAD(P)-dependent dehydrogenase (Short-subunit alcohol dehydrogenase family) n=1 Tax=Longispora fulva TaxID=619741 RepID=A0A8J7GNR2_9ACTN|nr:SDR family oxidoreductase [Longispora fulva]MBG6140542.1 NAD(P)-dependent dehydrogenase (short-subunit alcohol dehydrogenase family) [Longispora fulva]